MSGLIPKSEIGMANLTPLCGNVRLRFREVSSERLLMHCEALFVREQAVNNCSGFYLKRVLQVSMNGDVENWANLHKSGLNRSGFKIQLALLPRQLAQQSALRWGGVQQRVRPQQHGGVSQQRHAPSQSQAVEKHRAQSELIFLVRLRWFNPRTDLLQQAAGGQRVERQQSQQGFVSCGRIGKLAGAVAGLPTMAAEFCRGQWSKPM
jgi:hypothetical protein